MQEKVTIRYQVKLPEKLSVRIEFLNPFISEEFERSIIRERVIGDSQGAKSQGKRLGRPPIKAAKIKELQEQGLSIRKIGKRVSISQGKVHAVTS
jgi:DNA invertase Pin-like site-specific DNA recombinase